MSLLRSKISLLILFVLLVLGAISIWAVQTQRLELRKKAATIESTAQATFCWDRVYEADGGPVWPDSCRGEISTDTPCLAVLTTLTDDQKTQYQAWVLNGKPPVSGCFPTTSPCTTLPTDCQNDKWQDCTALMGAPETGRWCPWPKPVSGQCSGQPDGTACDASNCPVCEPNQPCPLMYCRPQPGVCQGGQCIPSQSNPVELTTGYIGLTADDFVIYANGKQYYLKPDPGTTISINSDPGSSRYTTLETIWHEGGVEMRLFIYFASDGQTWWATEARTYNGGPYNPGQNQYPDWITYQGPFFQGTPRGSAFTASIFCFGLCGGPDLQGVPASGNYVRFRNLKLQAFIRSVTPYPTPSPGCHYEYPQCAQPIEGFRAPCDPILICPSPRPSCPPPPPCGGSLVVGDSRYGGCPRYHCPITPTPTRTPTPTPYIQVLTPNGGERLTVGQSYTINWRSSPGIAGYLIYLVNSLEQVSLINGVSAPNTSYTWMVNSPMMQNTKLHKIKIVDAIQGGVGSATQDLSDNFFTINSRITTPTPTSTPTPTPPPKVDGVEFRIKFSGVTGGAAEGAGVTARFVRSDLDVQTSPIRFHHIGDGVYQAVATLSGTLSLPAGPGYTIIMKGEKHVARKFCKQSGQTSPCQGNESMTITASPSPVFDFTGLSLDPGDLPPQDFKADLADLDIIRSLLSKPCSALTPQDKKAGDLDYNGCVDIGDVYLMRKTLETRYDEN